MKEQISTISSLDTSYTIALVGNPNVGKSTVFNALTGLKQHTGNWSGKTVTYAQGFYTYQNHAYTLIDLPGTYSLTIHSKEEEVTRDFICFNHPDAVIVVCDATCLERNLNLLFQTLEITSKVILCVNLMDEAHRKHIHLNLACLSRLLGIPVISTCAKSTTGLNQLMLEVHRLVHLHLPTHPTILHYPDAIEEALGHLLPYLNPLSNLKISLRFWALKLLEDDPLFSELLITKCESTGTDISSIQQAIADAHTLLSQNHITSTILEDYIVTTYIHSAEDIASQVITKSSFSDERDRKLDQLFIGRYTRFPIMLLLFAFILWLTIIGANYPSELLFNLFSLLETKLTILCITLSIPDTITSLLLEGVYRVLTWVISVMLPPMAIFFPLFTLLEDLGYLPRIAFNLDHTLKKCHACGKQALTICMGLGCNAVGVEGCRIIDSPRERLIALLTNSFIPCNGRFPTLILLINLFFVPAMIPVPHSILSALLLLLAILLSLTLTFFSSYFLSKTLLKGIPSSFTLELPPYRKPNILQTLIRSLLDRTLYVLKRAIIVAAPTGLIIWFLAHITINHQSLLYLLTQVLDPFASFFGLNGVILTAFILGIPANEIVFPIIMMIYMSSGVMMPLGDSTEIKNLLLSNGWTATTSLCTILFLLVHWPCSTTLITIYKETKSLKWTLIGFLLPTLTGLLLCFLVHHFLLFF